jgi:tetratricopeptide (TPR) repeat protein
MTRVGIGGYRIPLLRIGIYLFILIALIYSNTLDADWHLDDYDNILLNRNIQIESLAPESLGKAVYVPFPGGERIARPLPMLSFALNWYAHGTNPHGYHLVNITLHFMSALFLYLTIAALLQKAPRLKPEYSGQAQAIALLAVICWAVNPVQTQAVTYIVQRMTAMAAMFYLLSLYFYVQGRLCPKYWHRYAWWLGSMAAWTAGMASKENAVLLPLAVALTEAVFFINWERLENHRRLWIASILGLLCLAASAVMLSHGQLDWILRGYENRPFSLTERLLTQPRVIWYYLSLLVYPIPFRLSIEHDFTISTGLLQPWTTLPALIGIAGLLIVGFLWMRRKPLLSFALLFFLLNHVVESTILPLEMVFEHRNYLPSLFLFAPIAAGAVKLMTVYRRNRRSMFYIVVGFGICLIIGWGTGTYIRNQVWATEGTLWQDALAKAPQSQRSLHNLAWAHFERIGDLNTAYALYHRELQMQRQYQSHGAMAYNNMANISYLRGQHLKAAAQWEEASRLAPRNATFVYRRGLAYLKAHQYEKAIELADQLLSKGAERHAAHILKGKALLRLEEPEAALYNYRRAFKDELSSAAVATEIGIALLGAKRFSNARILLTYAHGIDSKSPAAMVWLSRLAYLTGDHAGFAHWIGQLGTRCTVAQIRRELRVSADVMPREMADPASVDTAVLNALIE